MSEVLREYVVSLGFSVNQNQYAKFKDALKSVASETVKLGTEVVGVGVALTAMVDTVAKQFESLYYMSQRTGATVQNLDAISYAAEQVGVSSDEAKSAIEGFASAMRRQPGLRNMFEGVTGHKATGDAEVDIRNFVRSQRNVADQIALQRADALHIPEHLYLQYKNNLEQVEAAEADHIKRMKAAGLDVKIQDRRWVDFSNTIKHLGDQFKITGDLVAESWRPAMTSVTELLDKWVGSFNNFDKESGGWATKLLGLGIAIGSVSVALSVLARFVPLLAFLASPSVLGLAAVAAAGIGVHTLIQSMADREKKNPTPGIPVGNIPAVEGGSVPSVPSVGSRRPRGGMVTAPVSAFSEYDNYIAAGAGNIDNSRSNTFNVSQSNNYVANNVADAQAMAGYTAASNAGLATALRNLASKLQ